MIDETRVYSKTLAFSLAGLVAFITLCEFGLVTFITDQKPPHYNATATLFIYFAGIVAPILMLLATKYSSVKLPAMIWYHLTMCMLLLWFSEIVSPFTALWSLLVLFASIYYGWRGFVGSSGSLVLVSLIYCLMFSQDLKPTATIYAVIATMVVLMTILTSYLFVRIIMSAQKKNRDLTKAQQSEMLQVNRLNTLLNSISDAVLTLNRYGRVTSQNAAAQVFFDTNESLVGRDIDKILLLKDSDNESVSIRKLIDLVKSSSLRDDLSVGEGGDVRHLSIQIARIRSTFGDSEEYGVVLIIRDITRQKTLEDEKDEFISVTSHELRTPVAIAEGSLSNFLLMQERNMPQNKLIEAAEAAHKQIIYLAQMINDLSTLSRAERGVGDDVEPIDVNELLYNLFAKYTPEAESKSLRLDLDAEHHLPEVETSRLYLEEIIQNFITNAIKYTKEGTVTFGAKKESEGYVRFFVKDTGIGMSKSDLQHIFEKFYRSEDYRTRETSGTGLGLYVVEELANKLGTKINVESRLNVGSTFSFVLAFKSHKLKKIEDKAKAANSNSVEMAPVPSSAPAEAAEPAEVTTTEAPVS